MAEWSKAHAWRACSRQKWLAGSNPALSAKEISALTGFDGGGFLFMASANPVCKLAINKNPSERSEEGLKFLLQGSPLPGTRSNPAVSIISNPVCKLAINKNPIRAKRRRAEISFARDPPYREHAVIPQAETVQII